MENGKLNEGEQLDELGQNGLRILQKKGCFRYGTDAVVLSDFAAQYIPAGSEVLDIGTGTGILPLLLSAKTEAAHLTGIEIQQEMAELAERSVLLNEKSGAAAPGRIKIIAEDVKKVRERFPARSFDVIVTNPPYKRQGAGILNEKSPLTIARHEIACTLSDITSAASYLLKNRGHFMMINHPERLADTIELLRRDRLEPKELQFVYSDIGSRPILFLIHAILFGGKNLVIEKGIEVK